MCNLAKKRFVSSMADADFTHTNRVVCSVWLEAVFHQRKLRWHNFQQHRNLHHRRLQPRKVYRYTRRGHHWGRAAHCSCIGMRGFSLLAFRKVNDCAEIGSSWLPLLSLIVNSVKLLRFPFCVLLMQRFSPPPSSEPFVTTEWRSLDEQDRSEEGSSGSFKGGEMIGVPGNNSLFYFTPKLSKSMISSTMMASASCLSSLFTRRISFSARFISPYTFWQFFLRPFMLHSLFFQFFCRFFSASLRFFELALHCLMRTMSNRTNCAHFSRNSLYCSSMKLISESRPPSLSRCETTNFSTADRTKFSSSSWSDKFPKVNLKNLFIFELDIDQIFIHFIICAWRIN